MKRRLGLPDFYWSDFHLSFQRVHDRLDLIVQLVLTERCLLLLVIAKLLHVDSKQGRLSVLEALQEVSVADIVAIQRLFIRLATFFIAWALRRQILIRKCRKMSRTRHMSLITLLG